MAAQELGSKRQVSVSAVPKHSNLLGAQCVPDKNLQNLDPGKKNSSAGSWRSPTACFGYLFFFSPRNPKFSSLLLRTHPKHPLHLGGKVNSRKPFLGTVTSNATMNGTLRIPSPPFSFSPSTPVPLFSQPQA